jgi:hypothetical protein
LKPRRISVGCPIKVAPTAKVIYSDARCRRKPPTIISTLWMHVSIKALLEALVSIEA